MLNQFSSVIGTGFRQALGITPANKFHSENFQRSVQNAQAMRSRAAAQLAAASQKGAVTPQYYDTSGVVEQFTIKISTAGLTGTHTLVFGSAYATDKLYKRVDKDWTGNDMSLVINDDVFEAIQDLFNDETYDFKGLSIRATPTDQTNTGNADLQLESDIIVYKFGRRPGFEQKSLIEMAGTEDPTQFNQMYRYVDLARQGQQRINKLTAWELAILSDVQLSITFFASQRIKTIA